MRGELSAFSSADLPRGRRTRYWADTVRDLTQNRLIDAFGTASLDGNIVIAKFSDIQIARIEFSGFRLGLVPEFTKPFRCLELMFQIEGISFFTQGGRKQIVCPGDCIAYDNGVPFSVSSEGYSKAILVEIRNQAVYQRGIYLKGQPAFRLTDSANTRIIYNLLDSIVNECTALSDMTANGLVDFMLLPFREHFSSPNRQSRAHQLLCQAKFFIGDMLKDPDLSVDHVADHLGCSKRYVHKIFSHEGATVTGYIRRQRLERCREELEESNYLSVTDIAFSWGFSSSSHFSRLFKHEFGFLPSSCLKKGNLRN